MNKINTLNIKDAFVAFLYGGSAKFVTMVIWYLIFVFVPNYANQLFSGSVYFDEFLRFIVSLIVLYRFGIPAVCFVSLGFGCMYAVEYWLLLQMLPTTWNVLSHILNGVVYTLLFYLAGKIRFAPFYLIAFIVACIISANYLYLAVLLH